MRPLFNVPGCGAFAVALGISSGYPVGAKISNELYESDECTKIEAERLLAFTNTSGPLFIISAVGNGMFGNQQIGILLLVTHFLASLAVGILFRKYKYKDSPITRDIISHPKEKINKNDKLCISKLGFFIGNAIQNAISTLLLICRLHNIFCGYN
jgi:sporulation integral membrane protein YlbJ